MQYISRNDYIIAAFAAMSEAELYEGNELNFLTAAGVVSGRLIRKYDEENVTPETFAGASIQNAVHGANERFKAEWRDADEPHPVAGDGFIVLEDVTIRRGENRMELPHLVLFLNQVVGVNIGSLKAQG